MVIGQRSEVMTCQRKVEDVEGEDAKNKNTKQKLVGKNDHK